MSKRKGFVSAGVVDEKGLWYPPATSRGSGFLALMDHDVPSEARIVVIPFGLEKTTSYAKGTAQGPTAIVAASHQIELYNEETQQETYRVGVTTLCEPRAQLDSFEHGAALVYLEHLVRRAVNGTYPGFGAPAKSMFPIILGGEHSLTVGAVKALHDLYGPISILHFDAHTDLRSSYEGSELSHACAMTLCLPYVERIVSVGIRSHNKDAQQVIERQPKNKVHILWDRADIRRRGIPICSQIIWNLLMGKRVYCTFDVDVFTPALIGSSTGTPEPGGLDYNDVLDIWADVFPRVDLIGGDFVEHRPIEGLHAPDFTVARLVYKFMGYVK